MYSYLYLYLYIYVCIYIYVENTTVVHVCVCIHTHRMSIICVYSSMDKTNKHTRKQFADFSLVCRSISLSLFFLSLYLCAPCPLLLPHSLLFSASD